jgi:hypothetical protein
MEYNFATKEISGSPSNSIKERAPSIRWRFHEGNESIVQSDWDVHTVASQSRNTAVFRRDAAECSPETILTNRISDGQAGDNSEQRELHWRCCVQHITQGKFCLRRHVVVVPSSTSTSYSCHCNLKTCSSQSSTRLGLCGCILATVSTS